MKRSVLILIVFLTACGDNVDSKLKDKGDGGSCSAPSLLNTGKTAGSANIFKVDPISDSGNLAISHTSNVLDGVRSTANLDNLLGKGVLFGTYADVRASEISCGFDYSAYSPANDFSYSHSDKKFQEAMTYYSVTKYRSKLDSLDVLYPQGSLILFPHCMNGDNAFYYTGETKFVCLGDSTESPGSFYADDASVVVHETQHGVTMEAYSPEVGLGDLDYDEAGAINEGLSDVMSLLFLEEDTSPLIDAKIFSRWALGTFITDYDGRRSVHKCPSWSTDYPTCGQFPAFSVSNNSNVISYQYPDGLGWQFGDNVIGPGKARNNYLYGGFPEEIHNTGVVTAGAVWDFYEALKSTGMSASDAREVTMKFTIQTLLELPKPSIANKAPVTMPGLASKMLLVAQAGGLPQIQIDAGRAAFQNRGLVNANQVSAGWATNPKVLIEDNANTLRAKVMSYGVDPKVIKQNVSGGINQKINKGETVAIWLDVENQGSVTAGGVLVKVKSLDPTVATFFSKPLNRGFVTNTETQIMIYKVNGTSIVNQLKNNQNISYDVPTGSTYFKTNPFYSETFRNAIWMQISDSVVSGQSLNFELEFIPSNGVSATTNMTLVVE